MMWELSYIYAEKKKKAHESKVYIWYTLVKYRYCTVVSYCTAVDHIRSIII